MQEVTFKKNGDPLKVAFVIKDGVMAAAYTIKLAERGSSQAVEFYDGDNQNPHDDSYFLPTPCDVNDNRYLRLVVDFHGLDVAMSKTFSLGMEIYQGDTILVYVEKSGILDESVQTAMLFAKLIMSEV